MTVYPKRCSNCFGSPMMLQQCPVDHEKSSGTPGAVAALVGPAGVSERDGRGQKPPTGQFIVRGPPWCSIAARSLYRILHLWLGIVHVILGSRQRALMINVCLHCGRSWLSAVQLLGTLLEAHEEGGFQGPCARCRRTTTTTAAAKTISKWTLGVVNPGIDVAGRVRPYILKPHSSVGPRRCQDAAVTFLQTCKGLPEELLAGVL